MNILVSVLIQVAYIIFQSKFLTVTGTTAKITLSYAPLFFGSRDHTEWLILIRLSLF